MFLAFGALLFFVLILDHDVDRVKLAGTHRRWLELLRILVGALHHPIRYLRVENGLVSRTSGRK
ncbi:MAG TPA: hypothetical protein VF123_01100 [Candidatus Sulfotelmatobacter sp.]